MSVIAGFSFLGIMLGVATLIIVMSVMNGFKAELMGRILGLNGHLGVYPVAEVSLKNYDQIKEKVKGLPSVAMVIPVIDGQAMLSTDQGQSGVMVRGMRQEDFVAHTLLSEKYQGENLVHFDKGSCLI